MAAAKTTRRAIDDAQVGLSWDMGDTALTIMNPAYGFYRLFGGRSATSSDGGGGGGAAPTGTVQDITKTEAYKAQQARVADLLTRGQSADQAKDKALQALQALRSAAPGPGAAPIAVTVPSFSLGRRHF